MYIKRTEPLSFDSPAEIYLLACLALVGDCGTRFTLSIYGQVNTDTSVFDLQGRRDVYGGWGVVGACLAPVVDEITRACSVGDLPTLTR